MNYYEPGCVYVLDDKREACIITHSETEVILIFENEGKKFGTSFEHVAFLTTKGVVVKKFLDPLLRRKA